MAGVAEALDQITEEGEEPTEARKGGKLGAILILLFGVGAGGAVGFTTLGPSVVGPMLAERAVAAPNDAAADDGPGGGGHGAEAEGGTGGAADAVHMIDNLVVNPARSSGTRFLLASIAVRASSSGGADLLSAHDIELRDALIIVLGSKTVDELGDISRREELVAEIRSAIEKIVGTGVVSGIYIPQFVIQ